MEVEKRKCDQLKKKFSKELDAIKTKHQNEIKDKNSIIEVGITFLIRYYFLNHRTSLLFVHSYYCISVCQTFMHPTIH